MFPGTDQPPTSGADGGDQSEPPVGQATGGGCICRAVRYTIDGRLRAVTDCHCQPCRRFTGHHMAATAVEVRHIIFHGTDTLTWYDSAPGVQYGFCGRCGSSLFWRAADKPALLSITAGSLDQPTGLRTNLALYTAEHGDYHTPEPVPESRPADREDSPGDG